MSAGTENRMPTEPPKIFTPEETIKRRLDALEECARVLAAAIEDGQVSDVSAEVHALITHGVPE